VAVYQYQVPGVDLARLQAECLSAGLPVDAVNGGAIGSADVDIITSRDLTAQEKLTLDGVVAAHDGRPRRARPFLELQAQINALTANQKKAVGDDLFGPSNKWAADVSVNRGALAVLWLLTQLNLTAAQTAAAKVAGAALYCQDFPRYLDTPPLIAGVAIPGDEPIPVAP
jgi:hypothetical protein